VWRRIGGGDRIWICEFFVFFFSPLLLTPTAFFLGWFTEDEFLLTKDKISLGGWFNCTANIERQRRVEEWIKKRYPEVWAEMEALGHWVTMDGFGYRQYNINRDLDP
jgi:hypothetical protein